MARARWYSPQLDRFLVSALYHEARRRKVPMTRLANRLLESALAGSEGWEAAVLAEAPVPYRTEPPQSIVDGQQTDKATAT
jgi:hypothetical protein